LDGAVHDPVMVSLPRVILRARGAVVTVPTESDRVFDEVEVAKSVVSVTDTEYVVPFVRPVIMQEVAEPPALQWKLDEDAVAVAVKPVTASPPSSEPADHVAVRDPEPLARLASVGASGLVTGLADIEFEGSEFPFALLSTTVTE
jgi:hypothetical protein